MTPGHTAQPMLHSGEGGGGSIVSTTALIMSAFNADDGGYAPSTEDMHSLVAELRQAGAAAQQQGDASLASGSGTTRRTFDCSPSALTLVVGHSGERIREMEARTGARIKAISNLRTPQGARVIIEGPEASVDTAAGYVEQSLELARSPQRIECPRASLGKVIGRNGERIKSIIEASGARLQVQQDYDPCYIEIESDDPVKLQMAREMVANYMEGAVRPWDVSQGAVSAQIAAQSALSGGGAAATAGFASLPSPLGTTLVQQPGGATGGVYDPYKNADYAWGSALDPQGRVYYYNAMTGQSQWDKPAHLP